MITPLCLSEFLSKIGTRLLASASSDITEKNRNSLAQACLRDGGFAESSVSVLKFENKLKFATFAKHAGELLAEPVPRRQAGAGELQQLEDDQAGPGPRQATRKFPLQTPGTGLHREWRYHGVLCRSVLSPMALELKQGSITCTGPCQDCGRTISLSLRPEKGFRYSGLVRPGRLPLGPCIKQQG